jgi:hypothetical protein
VSIGPLVTAGYGYPDAPPWLVWRGYIQTVPVWPNPVRRKFTRPGSKRNRIPWTKPHRRTRILIGPPDPAAVPPAWRRRVASPVLPPPAVLAGRHRRSRPLGSTTPPQVAPVKPIRFRRHVPLVVPPPSRRGKHAWRRQLRADSPLPAETFVVRPSRLSHGWAQPVPPPLLRGRQRRTHRLLSLDTPWLMGPPAEHPSGGTPAAPRPQPEEQWAFHPIIPQPLPPRPQP